MKAVIKLTQRLVRASMAFAWIATASAWADNGFVYDASGDVSIGAAKSATHAAAINEAIPADSLIRTGDKSYAVLKFKDDQKVSIQPNTAFHIKEYPHDPKIAGNGNMIISDFTGGVRIKTGLIGESNQGAFRISTPNATIDTVGSDTEFIVATLNDSLYSQVISGSVSMTNEAGTVTFTVGQTGLAASRSTLPLAIPAKALPTGVFSQLGAIQTAPDAEPDVKSIVTTTSGAVLNRDDNPKYFLCDFCTGKTHDPAHIAATTDDASADTVTGDATMFGKHNLTPSGSNTGEICAFCHTPQGSESDVASPQWNPSTPPLSSYRAFSTMGSATDEASGSISMACLSCHDGTQAPNIIINTPSNKLDIPDGDIVSVGRDLKTHHPVGMEYGGGGQNQNAPDIPLDPVAAYNRLAEFNSYTSLLGNKFSFLNRRGIFTRNDIAARNDVGNFSNAGEFDIQGRPKGGFNKSTYSGTGNGTVWWIETANSKIGRQKSDLYLFTRTDKIDSIPSESTVNRPYVECATCHDPHSTNPTFLRLPGGNARSQVCLTCHNK